ncbi:MAG: transporter substrate-binding protein [Deltaproteobacteria bacterium]|nr:transporter substrate-binding protein [Deltaproteobacteria bacterium]
MTRFYTAILLLLIPLLLSDQAGAAPLRIAYSSISGAMLPLWVAKDTGLFAKHGVDVDLTYIRGVAIEALLAGEVQFVRASPPSVVRSEDLKGKKIGVTNLGDSPDLVLSLLLEKWGLQRGKDLAVLGIRGGMPELLISVSKGFVDAGMISAPSNRRGIKMGLREFVDTADLGIPYINSPLSTRRSTIKNHRDTVLRVLRGYYEAVLRTRRDRDGAMKILAKYVRLTDPEILSEVYQTYGLKQLQPDINVDIDGIKGLLKGLGSEAVGANPTTFVDLSLIAQLEREGFFSARGR